MNTITRFNSKYTKDKKQERYCTVYESLNESLKEVKKHKTGEIHLDTWDEFYEKK